MESHAYGFSQQSRSIQRTADVVLDVREGKLRYLCMADIIVYTGALEDHIRDTESALARLSGAGLELKPKKC